MFHQIITIQVLFSCRSVRKSPKLRSTNLQLFNTALRLDPLENSVWVSHPEHDVLTVMVAV